MDATPTDPSVEKPHTTTQHNVEKRTPLDVRQHDVEAERNTQHNVELMPTEIQMPKMGRVKKRIADHFRRKGERFINQAIKQYAVLPDGSIDNELADSLRKELTRRTEVSLYRDVLEPATWTIGSSVILGAAGLQIGKYVEKKHFTPKTAMVAVSGVALGGVLDMYRIKRRFESGLDGALSGALRAVKEARKPRWVKQEDIRSAQAQTPQATPSR